jgi:hypothetical protein
MSTGALIVLIIVVVLVVAAGAWFVMQQSRRRRLRERFGPEYDRRVEESDDRRVVERELTQREKRHASFKLRTLSDEERTRYAGQWTAVQEQFVDRPGEAVVAAEQLVHKAMNDRGYPTDGNHEQHVSDLSVEHATAVDAFRSGHDVRTRHEQAGVSTEELRQALTHYRKIFVSLVGLPADRDETDERAIANHTDRVDPATSATTGTATAEPAADGTVTADPADRIDDVDHVDAGTNGVPHTETVNDRQVADEPRRTNT